jgi:hypothetical protein
MHHSDSARAEVEALAETNFWSVHRNGTYTGCVQIYGMRLSVFYWFFRNLLFIMPGPNQKYQCHVHNR